MWWWLVCTKQNQGVYVFNDTATTFVYTGEATLSLHDALPILDNELDIYLQVLQDYIYTQIDCIFYPQCFWYKIAGGNKIKISDVYLTNSDEYEKPNDLDETDNVLNQEVDVYNIYGICIMKNVLRNDAIHKLPKGTYIIGNEKIMILK